MYMWIPKIYGVIGGVELLYLELIWSDLSWNAPIVITTRLRWTNPLASQCSRLWNLPTNFTYTLFFVQKWWANMVLLQIWLKRIHDFTFHCYSSSIERMTPLSLSLQRLSILSFVIKIISLRACYALSPWWKYSIRFFRHLV